MSIPQYIDCPGFAGYNQSTPIYTEYDSCEAVKICWNYDPEFCDRPAQGFRVYRTTTPPITGTEALCVAIGNDKTLADKSKHKNHLTFYSSGGPSTAVFNNHTPYGVDPIYSSINFYREHKEYFTAGSGNHYDLSVDTFTLDVWVGKKQNRWMYRFPCETIISCYDATNHKRSWRLFFEPASVTAAANDPRTSIPHGMPSYQYGDQTTGSLVLELHEAGDGTGQSIRHVIMPTTSSSDWKHAFTGTYNRFGYGHICITRIGDQVKVYVDGGLKSTINVPFDLANPAQQVTVGRHFGNSGRVRPEMFPGVNLSDLDDSESYYDGRIYDVRLVVGLSVPPGPGGRPADICSQQPWYDTFDEVAVLPFNRTCWEDETAPVGKQIYYRVASVNCDMNINSICPAYISANRKASQEVSSYAVDNQVDLRTYMNFPPATLLEIFNTWDRCDPSTGDYFPGGIGATGDHSTWYYDTTESTFVQPNNAGPYTSIISPPNQYMNTYIHDVVMTSTNVDDDLIGSVGMYNNVGDQQYALMFMRTCGGTKPHKGWGAVAMWGDLGSGFGSGMSTVYNPTTNEWTNTCGQQVESLPINTGSRPLNPCSISTSDDQGWTNRTTRVRVERELNLITASTSPNNRRGSQGKIREPIHFLDQNTSITINLLETPPPPGMPGGWGPLQGKTGYGFTTQSQPEAQYHDWYLYPKPWQRIYDFTNGAPGEVWEYGLNNRWYKTLDSVWEVVGKTRTTVTDFKTGNQYLLDCDGSYTKL